MKKCHFIIIGEGNRIIQQSEELPRIAIHSCAKPFQMLPVCLLGLDEAYRLSPEELTLMASSALAQDIQVKTTKALLRKTDIQMESLRLEAVAPFGRIAYHNWVLAKKEKSPLYHPCIGNHIAMFLAQRALTGSGRDYLHPDSAIQRMIYYLIKTFFECNDQDINVSKDNCGSPCYAMPLHSLAVGYRNLCPNKSAKTKPYQEAVQKIRSAYEQYPVFLEGDSCLSTAISSCRGLIGKTGVNGTLGIGVDRLHYGIAIHSPKRNWANVAYTAQSLLSSLDYQDRTDCIRSCEKMFFSA